MYSKIKEELKGIIYEEGGWNAGFLWKLRRKIFPRPEYPPTAMENIEGVLLTDPNEIQKEAIKYYQNSLRISPWTIVM